jgi:predicted  nucleic acid-binding Zn-ribbon protein
VDTVPAWLAAIGVLLVISATLAAAVAVYRTTLLTTSLRVARETITDLRGEITDYERRETKLESDVRVLETEKSAANSRIGVLEDLLTKRKDDDEIRAEIAAVRKVVDENVIAQLSAILQLLEGGAKA